ncbi:MAG: efflux RND transporter permease subunit [Arcobacteraceae bacterium]|nr:efflux RND transporter permease subunit [Arcobacteraceae bacterium]
MNKDFKPTNIAGRLAKEFVYNPATSIFALTILSIGLLILLINPREENPQIVVSGGAVIVPMPGASAKEIKKIIVEPMEKKLKEIDGVEHIYGIAKDDVGIVQVSYCLGVDKQKADAKLYDKVIQNLDLLPSGAMQPIIKPFDIDADIPIVAIALYSHKNKADEIALYNKAKQLEKSLSQINNVSKVNIKGGKKEQYNILVDLHKLSGFNISLVQISNAIKSTTTVVPNISNSTKDGEKLVVIGIEHSINTKEDIQNIIIAQYGGSVVYLKDVANIEKSYNIQNNKEVNLKIRDKDGKFSSSISMVTIEISKFAGTNAVFVSDDIIDFLKSQKMVLEKIGMSYKIVKDDGDRANDSANELLLNIVASTVIIGLLIWITLGNRESLIVMLTVPLIISLSLIFIYFYGMTLNRVSLFAILLTMGLLVDTGIIVVENIHRHLYDYGDKESIDNVVVSATNEMGNSANIATIAIMLTSLPGLLLTGMIGEFTKPIPITMSVILLSSLLVGYVFVPYAAKKIMKRKEK